MINWSIEDYQPGRFVRAPTPSASSIDTDLEYGGFREPLRSSSTFKQPDALQIERDGLIQDLERLFGEILDDEVVNHLTAADLTVRKGRIEKYFQSFETVHRKYRRIDPQSSHDIFVQVEATCMNVMAKIITLLKAFEQGDNFVSSARLDRTNGAPTTFRVEMPMAPKVGTFTGNQADWQEFRDKFIAQVHDKDHINPVDKMTYLQEACQGDAKITMGPWPSTNEGYTGAWNQLLRAYNDKYHNVHGVISRMLATPKQTDETHESLRTVVSTISGGIRQLRTLIDPDVERDQLWIHLATQRLPGSTIDAWEQYRNRDEAPAMPTFEYFQKFLETRAKGRRERACKAPAHVVTTTSNNVSVSDASDNRSQTELRNKRRYDERDQSWERRSRLQSFKSSDRRDDRSRQPSSQYQTYKIKPEGKNTTQSYVCPLCNDGRPLYLCDEFRRFTVPDRRNYVLRSAYCLCCLNLGHLVRDCKYPTCRKCPDEPRKHHYLICTNTASVAKRGEPVPTVSGQDMEENKSRED